MTPRIFPFPALRADSLDFAPECAAYTAAVKRVADSGIVSVQHILSGKNLLARLLVDGRAQFACVVCAPSTMYRTLEVFSVPPTSGNSGGQPTLESLQEVGLDDALISSPPMFRPIVVAAEEVGLTTGDGDGLNPIYSGREVHFPKGAIIASAGWFQLGGGGEEMLILHPDSLLKSGMMKVEGDTSHGYRFQVKVADDLYRQIRRCPSSRKAHRDSILTHALSAGLQLLAREFGETEASEESGGWEQYPNLRLLRDWLQEKEQPIWSEPGFCAEKAASALKPHFIPEQEDEK